MKAKASKKLTDEQVALLKENALGILSESRKTLLNRFPFVGQIAMSLDLVPVRDRRISTMCTDGKAIYCSIDFLSSLSKDDTVFILGHEVYHNVLLHLLRRDSRDPETFNLATDMEVNNVLAADGLSVPKDAVTSSKHGFPNGLSAEEYYDMLQQDGANANASSKPLDKHVSKGDRPEDMPDEMTEDKYGEVSYDPDFMPEVTKQAVERVREAAVAAAQMIERQGGTLPGHLKKIVDSLLKPKLDWKEVLAQHVLKSAGETDRTWSCPNRRFASRGLYLPSSESKAVRIAVGIDTSGSVASSSKQFLSELNGIISSFGSYEITAIQCDTQVQDVQKFDDLDSPLDCAAFEFKGFGGTILRPVFDYVEDKQLDVTCIVMLTDGEVCDAFKKEDAPSVPVLWCVTKGGSTDRLPFGTVCQMD